MEHILRERESDPVDPELQHVVETAANDFYAQVYQNKLSIPQAVERLRQLQNQCAAEPPCADAAPMDAPPPLPSTASSSGGGCGCGGAAAAALSHATLDYTLRALLDQFPHVVKYAETELRVTAALLGTMVNERVLDGRRAAVALRFVHEALRHAPGPGTAGKMFRFGLFALFQFKPRLAEWPAYCESVAAVPHLARYHPDLVCELRAIADAAGDGGSGGGGGGGGAGAGGGAERLAALPQRARRCECVRAALSCHV
eukprot:TRINITY_DN6344_c1_g2_i1.p1 TRINITY_DN6344_c1_g2~~TRINITY_DN6344_c1_g2_i1.p1  ORF type:complete len:257 (+),score=88.94 TRINITY_DN6344_c1_g2_i1:62-832(+)